MLSAKNLMFPQKKEEEKQSSVAAAQQPSPHKAFDPMQQQAKAGNFADAAQKAAETTRNEVVENAKMDERVKQGTVTTAQSSIPGQQADNILPNTIQRMQNEQNDLSSAVKNADVASGIRSNDAPADNGNGDMREIITDMKTMLQHYQEVDEAEKKKHKKRQLLNAIGDGLANMANLYFTSKGAPNIKMNSGVEESEKWYDKMRKDRLADGDRALANKARIFTFEKALADAEERKELQRLNNAYRNAKDADERQRWAAEMGVKLDQLGIAKENAVSNRIRANNSGKRRGGGSGSGSRKGGNANSKKYRHVYVGHDGKYYGYNNLPFKILSDFYNRIPEDIREEYLGLKTDPSDTDRIHAIERYIGEDANFASDFYDTIQAAETDMDGNVISTSKNSAPSQKKKGKPY